MVSGKRRGPVGPGYMPKGGARAALDHNERVDPPTAGGRGVAAESPARSPEARTDARASASAGRVSRGPTWVWCVASFVAGGEFVVLVDLVSRR